MDWQGLGSWRCGVPGKLGSRGLQSISWIWTWPREVGRRQRLEPSVPGAERDHTLLPGWDALSPHRHLAIQKSRILAGRAGPDQSRGAGVSQAEPETIIHPGE